MIPNTLPTSSSIRSKQKIEVAARIIAAHHISALTTLLNALADTIEEVIVYEVDHLCEGTEFDVLAYSSALTILEDLLKARGYIVEYCEAEKNVMFNQGLEITLSPE